MANTPKTQIKFPDLPVPSPGGSEILARERSKATFDSDELARYIHGDEYLERQDRLLRILENEPLFDKSNVYYQSRGEKFRASMAKSKRMIQVRRPSRQRYLTSRLQRRKIGDTMI
jgi:acyl-CoA oxidase